MEVLLDILKDAIMDSIKLLPFLFVSYLIIELIEHKASDKIKKKLLKSGKFGSFFGALFGVVPQCGFSVTASTLYAGRVITVGTLIAVYLSTSDEAIPVLLAEPENAIKILPIILTKLIFGIVVGLIIDFFIVRKKVEAKIDEEKEHIHEICDHCDCKENIFLSVLKHTFDVFIFILLFNIILNLVITLIGEENLSRLLLSGNVFQPIVAGIIGIIPNCAASVLLTELYIEGTLSFASVVAGLSVGAGVGMLVLFKENKNVKENLKIVIGTFLVSVIFGILIELVGVIF